VTLVGRFDSVSDVGQAATNAAVAESDGHSLVGPLVALRPVTSVYLKL
jgi:hypothetical protein